MGETVIPVGKHAGDLKRIRGGGDAEIEKGMEDIKAGRVYSADEVEAEMKQEFGI